MSICHVTSYFRRNRKEPIRTKQFWGVGQSRTLLIFHLDIIKIPIKRNFLSIYSQMDMWHTSKGFGKQSIRGIRVRSWLRERNCSAVTARNTFFCGQLVTQTKPLKLNAESELIKLLLRLKASEWLIYELLLSPSLGDITLTLIVRLRLSVCLQTPKPSIFHQTWDEGRVLGQDVSLQVK